MKYTKFTFLHSVLDRDGEESTFEVTARACWGRGHYHEDGFSGDYVDHIEIVGYRHIEGPTTWIPTGVGGKLEREMIAAAETAAEEIGPPSAGYELKEELT